MDGLRKEKRRGFDEYGIIMQNNILWRIFFDIHNNWDKFVGVYRKRIRDVVLKEVEKFRHCGDLKHGFRLLVCEGCHEVKMVSANYTFPQ